MHEASEGQSTCVAGLLPFRSFCNKLLQRTRGQTVLQMSSRRWTDHRASKTIRSLRSFRSSPKALPPVVPAEDAIDHASPAAIARSWTDFCDVRERRVMCVDGGTTI